MTSHGNEVLSTRDVAVDSSPDSSSPGVKIEVDSLVKEFSADGQTTRAVDDVSFTIREGEFVSVVGPSGCGKSTLLRMIAGLEVPTSGHIHVHQVDPSRPVNAMVFQQESVFPWMNVVDNVGYGLAMRGVPKKQRREIVDAYLRKVGLAGYGNYYPHQLSGGMKQRVSVGRAFANNPEILLMDEPFAALDEQNKIVLQGELLRIWDGSNKAVVFVTHSIEEAVSLSDRVLVMTAHPGRIKMVDHISFERPRDVHSLRADPAFGQKCYAIWEQLRDEVEGASAGD